MKQIIFLTIYFLFLSFKNEEALANESMDVPISPRIVGGQNADIILHSYTLALRYRGNIICTAFALSSVDVLTAAHCFRRLKPPYKHVTVHSRSVRRYELGRVHKIQKVTIHPQFTGEQRRGLLHDIAHILLKEESKIELDENQLKADLPTEDVQSGMPGIMIGWGCTDPNDNVAANQLQMLQMHILNYADCNDQMPAKHLRIYHLCAIGSVGHGCALGDSGGPLVINNVAVGIQSWCLKDKCGAGEPEIFTNVFQEKDFLRSVMQEYPSESSSSSSSSSSNPEPDFKGKKRKRDSPEDSPNSNEKDRVRKITCTLNNIGKYL